MKSGEGIASPLLRMHLALFDFSLLPFTLEGFVRLQARHYSQAAPTIINRMNNTTINANPAPYPPPILTPPSSSDKLSYSAHTLSA